MPKKQKEQLKKGKGSFFNRRALDRARLLKNNGWDSMFLSLSPRANSGWTSFADLNFTLTLQTPIITGLFEHK